MLIVTTYVCEICGSEYQTADDAGACEALGLPDPLPFLPMGERIPLFGENGVEWATIVWVGVERRSYEAVHRWVVAATPRPFVSHNLPDDSPIPASAFDPRYGYDAFRYGDSLEDIRVWRSALERYGFTEADVCPLVLERVADLIVRTEIRGGDS